MSNHGAAARDQATRSSCRGKQLVGRYVRTALGDAVCADHAACRRCLGYHLHECGSQPSAVQSAHAAVAAARYLSRDLARRCSLPVVSVPVRLRTEGLGDSTMGVTRHAVSNGVHTWSIVIRPGLDNREFAMVYGHEITHVLVGGSGQRLQHTVEEGLCELVAWRYLRSVGSPTWLLTCARTAIRSLATAFVSTCHNKKAEAKLDGQRRNIREHRGKFERYPNVNDKRFAPKTITNSQHQIRDIQGRHPHSTRSWEDSWTLPRHWERN